MRDRGWRMFYDGKAHYFRNGLSRCLLFFYSKRFEPEEVEEEKKCKKCLEQLAKDKVWIYAPDGVGEHTGRDIERAEKK